MPRSAVLGVALVLLIGLGLLLTLELFLHNLRVGRTRPGSVVAAIVILAASLAFVVWAYISNPGEAVRTMWTPAIYIVVATVDVAALVLLGLAAGRRGRPHSSSAWITGVALLMTLIAGVGNAVIFFLWGPFGFG